MSNINDEMKATADYARKSAKEMFGQELDYTEQSIDKLENLLDQAYQSFANLPKDEKTKSAINRTVNIWGSYLGEYMRLKWGGTWILKDSERIVSVKNIEFSPIKFVYQKITNHPEYTAKKYLIEAESKVYPSSVISQQSQNLSDNINQSIRENVINQPQVTTKSNKNPVYILIAVGGILLVIIACIIGYSIFKSVGISFPGSEPTSTPTISPTFTSTITSSPSPSPSPTITPTPTKSPTPRPTNTPTNARTPTITKTPTRSNTATNTPTFTPQPGIGVGVNCGNTFTITVLEPPTYVNSIYYGVETAGGIFLVVTVRLVNETDKPIWVWTDDYSVQGEVDGRVLTYSADQRATNALYLEYDKQLYQAEISPSINYDTMLAFDVNPTGKNWILIIKPGSGIGKQLCIAGISLTNE